MRTLATVVLALAALAVAGSPATAAPAGTHCTTIVVPVKGGGERASAVYADGTSCRTAHALARGYLRRDGGEQKLLGYVCDLVSDGQIGCTRGRIEVQFDIGDTDADELPATCPRATLFTTGGRRYLATTIQRSPKVSCRFATDLLRAAYGRGPLRVSGGNPVFVLSRGWRCRNGRAGAACWNVERRSLNALPALSGRQRLAVTADSP